MRAELCQVCLQTGAAGEWGLRKVHTKALPDDPHPFVADCWLKFTEGPISPEVGAVGAANLQLLQNESLSVSSY